MTSPKGNRTDAARCKKCGELSWHWKHFRDHKFEPEANGKQEEEAAELLAGFTSLVTGIPYFPPESGEQEGQ